MCDFSGKLVAWLDRELPADEAAEVERHLQGCSGCRSDVDAFKRVSIEFDSYCDEVIAPDARRGMPRWVPVVSAAGAVAALLVLFLILPRSLGKSPAFHAPEAAINASPVFVANALPAPVSPVHRVHRQHAVASVQNQDENSALAQNQNATFLPEEPVI